MKFLCVECDEPMKLRETRSPDDSGSLTVRFGCPSCGRDVAMLTNPWETELVSSLGVKIGPSGEPEDSLSRCPFSGVVREMEAAGTPMARPGAGSAAEAATSPAPPAGPQWTAEALARLEGIPDFVRPMARQGIEHYATSNGHAVVDEKILDEARARFGM